MLWFTADHHFGHSNIIKYCNRPFKSVEHMNAEMVRRWNERVASEDRVFHLGDFCFEGNSRSETFKSWTNILNGEIILIRGNHDRWRNSRIVSADIKLGGRLIHLSHRPEFVYELNFCAHVHNGWRVKRKDRKVVVNVGVDVWDFYPVTLAEILDVIKNEEGNL